MNFDFVFQIKMILNRAINGTCLFMVVFFCSLSLWLTVVFNFSAMRNQIMCTGCRNTLLYPRGASNVCCGLCNTITAVLPPGMFPFTVFEKYIKR